MNKIDVSVIVPVYNVEEYIDKCLNSLINQTLKNIEIIVVNDGSPDNSQKIIDKYTNKYPKLVKSYIKENRGQGSARNFGLDKAKGDYISFVDSDDWLDEKALEKMYHKALEENSDIVICDIIEHFEKKDKKNNCTNYNSIFELTPSVCNKIFKRSIIKNKKFLEKIWYEDLNFTTKILFETNRISTINECLYHYNRRDISTMKNNNSLKNLDVIIALDDIIKYLKENNKYNKNVVSYLIFNHILVDTVNRVSEQKNKDKYKVIKKLNNYCKKNIYDYKSMDFYKIIPRNRKIIAWLNYNNMWYISKLFLTTKSIFKKRSD